MSTPAQSQPQPQPQPPKSRKADRLDSTSSSAPRKRRRRAVGSGAADDCFTCANRHVICDRRRPYCTQCLELGGHCSGYKTTLTWGVGVASRGKLRGLSLPVSGSQQAAAPKPTIPRTGTPSQEPPTNTSDKGRLPSKVRAGSGKPHYRAQVSQPASQSHDASNLTTPCDPDVKQTGRNTKNDVPSARATSGQAWFLLSQSTLLPQVDSSIATGTLPAVADPPIAFSSSTFTPSPSYSDVNIPNPIPIARWPQTLGFSSSSGLSYKNASSSPGYSWSQNPNQETVVPEAEDDVKVSRPSTDYNVVSSTYSTVPQAVCTQQTGRTPRMRYLISYYSEVISPVIVAFDGPTNPFRTYILELAQESETLQHAIAALSSSNLRQRKQYWGLETRKTTSAWQLSVASRCTTDQTSEEEFGIITPEDRRREESFHKAMAIKTLNTQLADPIQRRDDSVLGSLLILCLFHMCDTGVARFQTQFAGVRKLLALRGGGLASCSDVVKWFTRMFTWFDTLTATVNDRDGELGGNYLELTSTGEDQWALENLTGCDGRLFKLVSQLGRLNLLSQMKSVDPLGLNAVAMPGATLPASLLHYTPSLTNVSPDPHYMSFPVLDQGSSRAIPEPDPRSEFWREWHDLRQKLDSWRLSLPHDTSLVAGTSPSSLSPSSSQFSSPPISQRGSFLSHVLPANFTDLSNISESFRYAAILYLERLANPHIPPAHPRIQNLVYTALHYITAVKSDVYLLWPLFVTGSECTLLAHRDLIRRRCSGIQKDSGFINNLSCLQLLEKIWAGEVANGRKDGLPFSSSFSSSLDADQIQQQHGWSNVSNIPRGGGFMGLLVQQSSSSPPPRLPIGGEAFRWRKIIDTEALEGEYIVV
ncbi:hypothetical protein AJ80_05191 [Polytolypa hystricis UAMH7299]|uniref:Zn(2)-C6 fungal-type domain-containing protein n=1 Tax=Polytolypa hystricis (strain UAMH7299) TaxID=1447883 RepID=A0A2B7Y4U3_POLH7|nr:hypothetical protein AJ80_05191 [Polytolypa hystricis UAMH7299]